MKALYLDLRNGIAGDMFLGALIDLGVCLKDLEELYSLPLDNYEITAEEICVQNIKATDFQVIVKDKQPHRHLADILKIIENSQLSDWVKKQAAKIFQLLAEAEAKIHGTTPEKVHFHEVGAVDSIIDIIGTLIALEKLGIEKIYASIPHLGGGEVVCQHGVLPLPAPATLEILQDIKVKFVSEEGETVTPTGAALIKVLVTDWSIPTGKIINTGYGAGKRQNSKHPNVLRAIALEVTGSTESILLAETNLDDFNPELLPPVMEKLFVVGALDVYFTPIQMKKNRPAIKLSTIIKESDLHTISAIILKETSSFGLRYYPVSRIILERKMGAIQTRWGKLQVKVGYWEGEVIKVMPEFESAKELSEKTGVSLIDIYNEVNRVQDTLK